MRLGFRWLAPAPPLAALLFSLALAAPPVPLAAQDRGTVFQASAEVSSILIPVTVTDKHGRLVANLEREKFRLFIDGMEFRIHGFWREGGLPLSIAFVVDVSGSMGTRRLGQARQAIVELAKLLRPGDEVCLITFGAGEVRRRLQFGQDPDLVPRILEPLRGYGTTALYDVLTATPQVMDGAKNIRRAVLLFSDGVDTASQMTPDDAVKVLEHLADPLYAFGIEPPPDDDEARADSYELLLRRFAAASGGKYVRVDNAARLPEFGRALRQELTMRYIINIDSSGVGAVKWRTIEVRVAGNYTVQVRQGYRGTLP
ncbi:MAG: VWA domain-containing protein [Acidobacteria bacterium]|nr:VWA domain-containing protein [Acidobacteriota bacterium]